MRREAPKTELDLVPIMNMVTILIPFLLMSAAFTSVAVVDVSARSGGESTEEPVERPKVAITTEGFVFTRADGSSEPIPCTAGACRTPEDYDLQALRRELGLHKDRVPEGAALELITGDDVPYDVLIAVMDASRRDGNRDLYPDVLFASVPAGG